MRTGLALRDPLPWHDLVQIVQSAEETQYETVFVPEIAGREAFATLSGLAAATTRLGIGTGVVSITSRRPETTAMAAATVQESSGGRFILGLGAGTERRVDVVRSYVRLVRKIVEGEEEGGFRLALEVGSVPLPIWLAALGPKMISLCANIADGVLLNWCTPERVETARGELSRAAEQSGRDPSNVTVGVYVRACLAHEDAQALEALRPAVGEYAAKAHYRRQFEGMGVGEEARMAAKAFRAGEFSGVPEALVRAVCVFGSNAMSRLEAYADAGADLVVVYPVAARDPLSSIMGTVLAAAPSPAVEA